MYHPSFNIGIEEEYQLIDPGSRELLGFVRNSMSQEQLLVQEKRADFDFVQRVGSGALEAGTPVCVDVHEASEQLIRLRTRMLELGATHGFKVAAAGTHPFSKWEESSETMPRYREIAEDMQMIGRRLLAFGLHIHIGMEDRELAVDVMNTMRYSLPHILSLAGSSPFWHGRDTGLKSYRTVLSNSLPRSGIPSKFDSYQEYRSFVNTLVRTHSIPDAGRIYYDIMPHHRFSTLLIRIADMLPSVQETIAVTALLQAIVAWMVDLRQRNMAFRIYERTLVNENKFRAVRYGLDGKMIDFGLVEEKPARELIVELLGRVAPMAKQLGTEREIEHIHVMLGRGSSADQQRAVWNGADKDFNAVVDYIVRETEALA